MTDKISQTPKGARVVISSSFGKEILNNVYRIETSPPNTPHPDVRLIFKYRHPHSGDTEFGVLLQLITGLTIDIPGE